MKSLSNTLPNSNPEELAAKEQAKEELECCRHDEVCSHLHNIEEITQKNLSKFDTTSDTISIMQSQLVNDIRGNLEKEKLLKLLLEQENQKVNFGRLKFSLTMICFVGCIASFIMGGWAAWFLLT